MVGGALARPKGGWPVSQIHCHFCGGIIQDVATIEYRPPRASAQFAMPQPTPCTCSPPVVYEHPPVLVDHGGRAGTRGRLRHRELGAGSRRPILDGRDVLDDAATEV